MKTDWAAAATRAGNRVLAENQECQVAGLVTIGVKVEVDCKKDWVHGIVDARSKRIRKKTSAQEMKPTRFGSENKKIQLSLLYTLQIIGCLDPDL